MWCWYTLYLLILASVLTRMLLDSILLTLWVNYRKEITALSWSVCFLGLLPAHPHPHPPPTLRYKSNIWKTDFLMWKTEPEEQQSVPRWQNTHAPLRRLGLAHEWNCPYQQIRLKPNLKICSKQGELSTALVISTKVTSWWEGQYFICGSSLKACWQQNCHNFIIRSFFSLCQIIHSFDAEQACSARTGGFYQFISCSKGAHCSLL